MRVAAAIVLLAAVSAGCSILGYRDVNDLKSEAKYRLSKEIDRDPVLVYRDVARALSVCTRDPVAGPFRIVTSNLNRETDYGEISLTHEGRFIARYEISKTGDGKAQVSGWWLIGAQSCQPSL
jgi:hypothetical protein